MATPIILTAAEYVAKRRSQRPRGVTLATFDAAYPVASLVSEWGRRLDRMFRAGRDAGETVRPAVLRSMEQHIGDAEAYRIAQSLAKFYPVFPARWWEWMKAWQEMESQAEHVVVKYRR